MSFRQPLCDYSVCNYLEEFWRMLCQHFPHRNQRFPKNLHVRAELGDRADLEPGVNDLGFASLHGQWCARGHTALCAGGPPAGFSQLTWNS